MAGRECYHCKQWVEEGEAHDCWTTTEAALTADLSEDLRDAWERLRETAAEFGDQVHEVKHGDALQVAGFDVHVYGVDHALIHPDIPLVVNTGFLVDGELFHPGDSFTVPEDPVNTLLVPISAPWLKAGDMIDYFRAVAPARVRSR